MMAEAGSVQTVVNLIQQSSFLLKRAVAAQLHVPVAEAAHLMEEAFAAAPELIQLHYIIREHVATDAQNSRVIFRHVTDEQDVMPGIKREMHAISLRGGARAVTSVADLCLRHSCLSITPQVAVERGVYPTLSREQTLKKVPSQLLSQKSESSQQLRPVVVSPAVAPVAATVAPAPAPAAFGKVVPPPVAALKTQQSVAETPPPAILVAPSIEILVASREESEVLPIEAPPVKSVTAPPAPAVLASSTDASPPQRVPAKTAVAKPPAKKTSSKGKQPAETSRQPTMDMFCKPRVQSAPATAAPVKREREEEVGPVEVKPEVAIPASASGASTKPPPKKPSSKASKKPKSEVVSVKKLAKTDTARKMGSGKDLLDDSDDGEAEKSNRDEASDNDDDAIERKKFFQSNDFTVQEDAAPLIEDGAAHDELELCDEGFLLGEEKTAGGATNADADIPAATPPSPRRPELVSLLVSRQQKRPREEDASRPVSQASLHAFFNPEVAALYKKYQKVTVTRTTEEKASGSRWT